MTQSKPAASSLFTRYFNLELATTRRQRELCFGLRYRVYCEEKRFESRDQYPTRLESDSFDAHSLHALIRDRRNGRPAASVRLVLATRVESLPLEVYCRNSLHVGELERMTRRDTVCELSRLAVDPDYRGRLPGESSNPEVGGLLVPAAYLTGFALARIADRPRIYGMMEPWLPRLVARSGVQLEVAGDPMNYHGRRRAYTISRHSMEEQLQETRRPLYQALLGSLQDGNEARRRNVA